MAQPKTAAQYNDYTRSIRAYMSEGEKSRVRGYELLVELKSRPALWPQYRTFTALLREERLCPAYTFRLYEQSRLIFTQAQIVAIGIQTCNTVAAIKDPWLRARAKKQVVQWSESRKRYTYQDLHLKLRATLRDRMPKRTTHKELVASLRQQVASLENQVATLKSSSRGRKS
jgi:hypothetical protein